VKLYKSSRRTAYLSQDFSSEGWELYKTSSFVSEGATVGVSFLRNSVGATVAIAYNGVLAEDAILAQVYTMRLGGESSPIMNFSFPNFIQRMIMFRFVSPRVLIACSLLSTFFLICGCGGSNSADGGVGTATVSAASGSGAATSKASGFGTVDVNLAEATHALLLRDVVLAPSNVFYVSGLDAQRNVLFGPQVYGYPDNGILSIPCPASAVTLEIVVGQNTADSFDPLFEVSSPVVVTADGVVNLSIANFGPGTAPSGGASATTSGTVAGGTTSPTSATSGDSGSTGGTSSTTGGTGSNSGEAPPAVASLTVSGSPSAPGSSNVTITADGQGFPPLTYHWVAPEGWTLTSGEDSATASFTAPSANGNIGLATVTVMDPFGQTGTASAVLSTTN
jgi:hypothetical protein